MSANPPRVLIAMSGGVDSCVAAALLREQGFDAVGVFMRLGGPHGHGGATQGASVAHHDDAAAAVRPGAVSAHERSDSLPLPVRDSGDHRPRGCCSAVDAADARSVAAKLGIPFYAVNFEQDFARLIDDFADEYARGRTPNPCVRCNQWLKFGRLEAYADLMGADLIATGHYARLERTPGGPRLRRARDRRKDQSYVLFGVRREVLSRTLFPLGELSKDEVRDRARRLGLAVHDKPESQDICFVPDGDYAAVVERRRPGTLRAGEIRHVDGTVVGRHGGVERFTIGQRRGVGVAWSAPLYVTALDPAAGVVTVGPREALGAGGLIASSVSWIRLPESSMSGEPGAPDSDCSAGVRARRADRGAGVPARRGGHGGPPHERSDGGAIDSAAPFRAHVQIRYHHAGVPALIERMDDDRVRVTFDEPVDAVTPGQAAVFYDGDELLGGGWIERSLPAK